MEKIIEITSRIRKDCLKQQRSLESKIRDLELEHKRTPNNSILQELKENRHRLDKLLTYKAEGALCFTNQRYYEMGNRASCLLAFQLRKAQTDRIISKVKHPISKQLVVKPTEIAEAFAEYYKDLPVYNNFELNSTENKTKN